MCLVTEGKQSIVFAVLAVDACKSLLQIRAVDKDGVLQSRPGMGYTGAVDKSSDAPKRLQLLGDVPRGQDQPGPLG